MRNGLADCGHSFKTDALGFDLGQTCGVLRCLNSANTTSRKAAWAGASELAKVVGDRLLSVAPASDGAVLTRRASPLRLRFGFAAWGEVSVTAGAAQVAKS